MKEAIEIFCENSGVTETVKKGTTLLELAEMLNIKAKLKAPLIGAKVNYITRPLNHICFHPCKVRFIDFTDPSGRRIYVRTLCFILHTAIKKVLPEANLNVEHPISKGYFCTLGLGRNIQQKDIDRIKQEMQSLIAADIPILLHEEPAEKIISLFHKQKCKDTTELLETSGKLYSCYYTLGDEHGFFDGSLAPSTGYIKLFDILRLYDGILLRIPNRNNPVALEPAENQPSLFKAFAGQTDFLNILGVINVGQLNKAIKARKISQLVTVAEALQDKNVIQIANNITDRYKKDGVKIVLVSGPSSSGKTTFTKRMEIQLIANLLHPVVISLDDYYVERHLTPLDKNGNYDFEALNALDLPYLNHDLERLLKGETVELPRYVFETGTRIMSGEKISLKEGALLVLEGIHALNPELTAMVSDGVKYKVYVSALTTISLDAHNWVSTTDNRLIRRIIRDSRYRGYTAADTIARWQSVRNGEDKWVFPYQEYADSLFNSAMLYELAALRHKAEQILMEVMPNQPEYGEAVRLLKFLSYFNYINDNELPRTSLLREFIGKSSFVY